MRSTVIPAQITTVEDKIAGNLNLTQILILMIPIFWTVVVFAFLAPFMHFSIYKLILVFAVLFLCLTLSLRIKEKVVAEWLFVFLRFYLRPKYYLFDKNDAYLRTLDIPIFEKKRARFFAARVVSSRVKHATLMFNLGEFIRFDNLLKCSKYSISYKSGRKGGIDVAFQKIRE